MRGDRGTACGPPRRSRWTGASRSPRVRSRRPSTRAESRAPRCARACRRRGSSARARRDSGRHLCVRFSWASRARTTLKWPAVRDQLTIVVLEGDETGQELLEEGLRVLAPDVTGLEIDFPRFDLSLESRRATKNGCVHDAAAAIREHGLGLKAASVTPEGRNDVGSPNRILREEIGGRGIVRTGRRIPGVVPLGGVHAPTAIVRMAVGDAYGAKESRGG